MAIQPEGPAPYAPAQSVIDVIEGYRNRGFNTPFTPEVLVRAGVTDSLVPRVLLSLKQLNLIDDQGNPTEDFDALKLARGEDEYKSRLQAWLRGVYTDVLQYADPVKDSPARLAEAFRGYTPEGQRGRMVTLMLRLFEHAGLVELPKRLETAQARPAGRGQRPKKAASRTVGSAPIYRAGHDESDLPPALVGLLKQIPVGGSWTKDRRENFLRAFEAVLDFAVPVVEAPSLAVVADDAEEDDA